MQHSMVNGHHLCLNGINWTVTNPGPMPINEEIFRLLNDPKRAGKCGPFTNRSVLQRKLFIRRQFPVVS